MDTFRVFVYMLMRDASLKQRIPCIICISVFGALSAGKKCALYTGKCGGVLQVSVLLHFAEFCMVSAHQFFRKSLLLQLQNREVTVGETQRVD